MPRNRYQEVRVRVLDKCFQKQGGNYTIEDLVDACNDILVNRYGVGVSKRSIYNDIKYMREGFNAPIVSKPWDHTKRFYAYSDKKFSIYNNELDPNEFEKLETGLQLLSHFRGLPQFEWMAGLLAGLEDKFSIRGNDKCIIGLEQNIDYVAIEYLSELMDAIINKQVLQIHYRTFDGVEYNWTLHPYYIKQYNSRWFLFGRNNDEPERIYNVPLDRIVSCKRTKIKYIENDLVDFDEYFDDIIGVTVNPNQKEFSVLLKFDKARFPYVISKPLHGSMRIKDKENGIVELQLKPNKELEALIFSFGNQVEVLEPKWLRHQIAEKIKDLSNRYSDVQVACTEKQ